MDDIIRKKLLDLGWSQNTRYPNTERWHFFEIRNFNVLRVVCLVGNGDSSREEVQQIKNYLRQRMRWFTLRDMGLVIVFSGAPRFVDLSNCLSKFAEKITVQKIIQLTPEKIYDQNTWVTRIVGQFLGNFLPEIAGTREVVTSKIDGGILERVLKKNWLLYAALLAAFLGMGFFIFATASGTNFRTGKRPRHSRRKCCGALGARRYTNSWNWIRRRNMGDFICADPPTEFYKHWSRRMEHGYKCSDRFRGLVAKWGKFSLWDWTEWNTC